MFGGFGGKTKLFELTYNFYEFLCQKSRNDQTFFSCIDVQNLSGAKPSHFGLV